MLFMGIDPGYGRLGYALVQKEKQKLKAVCWGVMESSPQLEHPQRLLQLYNQLSEVIGQQEEKIVLANVEQVFFRKNLTTGVKLLQARGVILLNLATHNIPVTEISPTEVKKMITGHGNSKKDIIIKMVTRILSLSPKQTPNIPDDAFDALAMAVGAWLKYNYLKLGKKQ